ncbi:MAG: c-type cytochrome [Thermodesulfobacteriota bacterium]
MRIKVFLQSILIVPVVFFCLTPLPSRGATARDNYDFYCTQCHGLEGRGDGPNATESQPVDPRDHRSAYEMKKLNDDEIIDVIKDGGAATSKSTLMPAFRRTLSDKEIEELKDYLRELCKCQGV